MYIISKKRSCFACCTTTQPTYVRDQQKNILIYSLPAPCLPLLPKSVICTGLAGLITSFLISILGSCHNSLNSRRKLPKHSTSRPSISFVTNFQHMHWKIPGFTMAGSTSVCANNTQHNICCVSTPTLARAAVTLQTPGSGSFQPELCSEVFHVELRLEEESFWMPGGGCMPASLPAGLRQPQAQHRGWRDSQNH